MRPGIDLHVSELPVYARCRLAALLDPPHPLGRDWLLLALGLGVESAVPQIDAPEMVSFSHTDCLLALWSRNPESTVRRLLEAVRATLQRSDVEEALLRLTPLCRSSTSPGFKHDSPSPGTNLISAAGCHQSQRNGRMSSTSSASPESPTVPQT